MKFFVAVLALAAGAAAYIPGTPGGWSAAEVEAARAAHLAEVSRISGERLGALSAALSRAGQAVPVVSVPILSGPSPAIGGGRVWSSAEVDAARAAHLGEVARITSDRLTNLRAVLFRNGEQVPDSLIRASLPQESPEVAAARAAHLAEHARLNAAIQNKLG